MLDTDAWFHRHGGVLDIPGAYSTGDSPLGTVAPRHVSTSGRAMRETPFMPFVRISLWVVVAIALVGCSDPSASVTVTNRTGEPIRLTGNCVADDPHSL